MRDFLYCLVFPHPKNNHRAHFLHPKLLFLVITFFIFGALFFSSPANPLADEIKAFADISVQELLNNTNQKRQENGLPALANNPLLAAAAGKKADDMFAKNYWAHNSPDGTTPWFFIKQSGYNYVYAGENLARGFNSATDVINAWMASTAGHKENLLSKNFKDVGFAVKSGTLNGEQTFLVVQEFGSTNVMPIAKNKTKPKAVVKTKKVLGFEASTIASQLPHPSVSAEIVIIFMSILIAVFFIDMFFMRKKSHIVRFVGHNLDHAIFLIAMVIIISIVSSGSII